MCECNESRHTSRIPRRCRREVFNHIPGSQQQRPRRSTDESRPDAFANPWDCGMYENWCQVMGQNILGWLFPLEVGRPWFSHRAHVSRDAESGTTHHSFFPTSVDVQMMKARAGLVDVSTEDMGDYDNRLERRRRFPYLLGGAGAPRVCFPRCLLGESANACSQRQWAASCAGQRVLETP